MQAVVTTFFCELKKNKKKSMTWIEMFPSSKACRPSSSSFVVEKIITSVKSMTKNVIDFTLNDKKCH